MRYHPYLCSTVRHHSDNWKILESTENNLQGWILHTQGVARLVEARGPESYDSPLAHMCFANFRHTIVCVAARYIPCGLS